MDAAFSFPASPGTPLFPVSPERSNRQHHQPPSSPSRNSESTSRERDPFVTGHLRDSSDVQGKVAQFNNLTKEAAQRRKDNEAALKRAVLGREEAESETRRLKDDNDSLRREIEEGRGRERKVGERLESVLVGHVYSFAGTQLIILQEELHRTKETQAHAHTIYEKEVRRARKEAFKSSSALVNLQEELKTARNRYTLMRVEADEQRRSATTREQEVTTAQKDIQEVQEELKAMKEQLKLTQDERDALKATIKDHEALKSATEGAVAVLQSKQEDAVAFGSPKKNRKRDRESRKHYREYTEEANDAEASLETDELAHLKSELRMEKRMRLQADERAHLLQIECQFGCCPCQDACSQGSSYVHDNSLSKEMSALAARLMPRSEFTFQGSLAPATPEYRTVSSYQIPKQREKADDLPAPTDQLHDEKHLSQEGETTCIVGSPESSQAIIQIFERAIDSSAKTAPSPDLLAESTLSPSPSSQQSHPLHPVRTFTPTEQDIVPSPTSQNLELTEIIPSVPFMTASIAATVASANESPTTFTMTSSVPLKEEAFFSPAPATPGGISREEALEQIRARRGRARSYAAAHRGETPKRGVLGTPRREISAPAGRRDV